jgi:uncharacterized protein with HEPN domain
LSRTDRDRLLDAAEFARHAMTHAAGLSANTPTEAARTLHATLYAICVLGEALHRVSLETQSLAPQLSWKKAYALRNRIVHSYWRIDATIIADVIERDLPPLVADLHALIARIDKGEASP